MSEQDDRPMNDRPMNDTTMPIREKTAPRSRRRRPGFGLHDWSRLCRTAKDLAQRKGQPLRKIAASEIAQHSSIHDAWISLQGKVYNLTPYLHYHPGGVDILKSVLGKDATALFDKYHRWVNVDGLIGTLLLGYLAPDSRDDEDDTPSYLPPGMGAPVQKSSGGSTFAAPLPRPPK